MYRKVKKKIAASITNLDSPATKKKAIEISAPENWAEPVEAIQQAGLIPLDFYKLNKPKYALVKITFPEVKLEDVFDQFFIKKSKTNVVFFDFGRTKSKNVAFGHGDKTVINFSASVVTKKDGIYLQTKAAELPDTTDRLSTSYSEMKFEIEMPKNSGLSIEKGSPAAIQEIKTNLEKDIPIEINFRPKTADIFGIYGKELPKGKKIPGEKIFNEFIESDFSLPATYLDSSYYLMSVPKIIDHLEEQIPTVFEVSLSEAALAIGDLDAENKIGIKDLSETFGLGTSIVTESIDYLEKYKNEISDTLVSENKLASSDSELPDKPAVIDLLKEFKDEVKQNSKVYKGIKLERFSKTKVTDVLGSSKENINDLPAAASVTEIWANEYFSVPEIVFELTDIKDPKFEKPKLFRVTFQDFDPKKVSLTDFNISSFSSKVLTDDLKIITAPSISKSSAEEVVVKSSKAKIENSLAKFIEVLSQPSVELSAEEKATILTGLYNYQIEGVDFLSMNKRAILADELGLGKTLQTIMAIKLLVRQREVRKVLIVANIDDIGSIELSQLAETSIGWVDNLDIWANEFSYSLVSGPKSKRKTKWDEKSFIKLIDYKSLQNDFSNKNITHEDLSGYDCVIFDEFTKLVDDKEKFESYIKDCNSKFIWNITSSKSNFVIDEVNSIFFSSVNEENAFKVLHRSKQSVSEHLPIITRQDKWIEFDNDQTAAYKKAWEEGRNQLENFLSTGNILRFQANVLFLLHKLNQLANFTEEKLTSNKSALLIQQIKTIQNNNSQVIVYSNYDKQGTQQLETILHDAKIKFIKFLAGMSAEELSTAANKFSNDKSITVLLASFKSSGARKALPSAPYLIHFDPLWSPTSQWQVEDTIVYKSKEQANLVVYCYRSDTEIERSILKTLSSKGFLNRNLCDNISPQTFNNILSDDEWKHIIGLKQKDKKENSPETEAAEKLQSSFAKIDKLKSEELVEKISSLFKSLGYKNVEMQNDNNKDGIILTCNFDKDGKELSAKINCAVTENINHSAIKEFVHFQSKKKEIDRLFVVSLYPLPADIVDIKNEKITFIDRELLAKYMQHFNLL